MRAKVRERVWPLLCVLLAITTIAGKHESTPRPQVPDNLKVPGRERILLKAHGVGVQIYVCKAIGDSSFAWAFEAPEADLTDGQGQIIAKHFAGPTWEAKDGSRVVGEIEQKAAAPKPGAIPWLLLKAQAHTGSGTFEKVTYIQRVDTEGGIAPANGCDRAHMDTKSRVDYRANYYFYVSGSRRF
jgi:hypothetical protein